MITIKHKGKVLIACDSIEDIKYFLKKKIEDQHKRVVASNSFSELVSYNTDAIKRVLVQKLKACEKLEQLNELLGSVGDCIDRAGIIKGCDFPVGDYNIKT